MCYFVNYYSYLGKTVFLMLFQKNLSPATTCQAVHKAVDHKDNMASTFGLYGLSTISYWGVTGKNLDHQCPDFQLDHFKCTLSN